MNRVLVILVVGACGCAGTTPVRAFDAKIVPRVHAAGDQAVATIYDPRVCSFSVRGPAGAQTIAMPDHVFRWFSNGVPLLAVAPLPPGHYRLTAVALASATRRVEHHDVTYGYTDCTRNLSTRALDVRFDVVSGQVTLLALPGGTISLKILDEMTEATSMPSVRAREAAWLPSLKAARRALRAKLVAAKRQPHRGYDVYPDCGLFGSGTAVVRTTGTPFSFYAHPNDTAAFDRFRGAALAHVWVPSMHASGLGAGCVERYSLMVMISNPAELAKAVRKAGDWLVHANLRGEIVIEVGPVPHLL